MSCPVQGEHFLSEINVMHVSTQTISAPFFNYFLFIIVIRIVRSN